MTRKLANLGLDGRFIFFVIVDAGIGLFAACFFLAIWFSPTAGVFAMIIGAFVALANFLLGGVPSALVWAIVVMLSKRFGASLRLACSIAAPLTAVFASAFLFLMFGLWLGDGRIDVDGAHVLALAFAPVSVVFAPFVAWKIYRPVEEPGKPDISSVRPSLSR